MLTPDEKLAAAPDVRRECRKIVRPFVALFAHLPRDEFRNIAKAYVQHSLDNTMRRTKGELDELDHMFIDNYWPALLDEYEERRGGRKDD